MSDFFQNGVITTLHKLRDRPIESIEEELSEFGRRRPMALILPNAFLLSMMSVTAKKQACMMVLMRAPMPESAATRTASISWSGSPLIDGMRTSDTSSSTACGSCCAGRAPWASAARGCCGAWA